MSRRGTLGFGIIAAHLILILAALIPSVTRANDILEVTLAPSGSPLEAASDFYSELVRLPDTAVRVEAVDLRTTANGGTRTLPADRVHVSPILQGHGGPSVLVYVDAASVGALGRVDVALHVEHEPLPRSRILESGPRTHRGVYLIIAADAYVDQLADLVAWKTQLGYEVHLATISETGSSRESIRSYLQNAYDTWTHPPEYLLLVGDVDDVPTGDVGERVTDHIYACLHGDDVVSDLYVGRFAVESTQDVLLQVAKTVGYESSPDTLSSGGAWFSRALLVAGNVGSTTPEATSQWIGDRLLETGYTDAYTCFTKADDCEGGAEITGAVNYGVGMVTYRGWAYGDNGWHKPFYTVDEIPTLANGWQLPVVFSIVCHTGNYGRTDGDCFGEVWMKTGSVEEPAGGVAFVGTGEHWSHSRWNDAMALGLSSAFVDDGQRQMGPILVGMKNSLLPRFPTEIDLYDAHGVLLEESVAYYNYIYNLLGDPSLQVWTAKPQALAVVHPASIAEGANFIEVEVQGAVSGTPIAGASIALCQEGSAGLEPIGYATTGTDGTATVPIAAVSSNPITLTVSGEDLYPWQVEIAMEQVSQSLVCTGAAPAGGATLLPGATVDLDLEVENTGSQALSLVAGTVTAPETVTLADPVVDFGNISAGETAQSEESLEIIVEARAENGTRLRCVLDATAGAAEVGSSEFWLEVEAPELMVTATGEETFDPGEETDLILTLRNDGVAAGDMSATLSWQVPDQVTLIDSAAVWSAISTGSEATLSDDGFRVQLAAGLPVGTVIPLELSIEHVDGPISTVPFTIVVGEVDFSAPSGPDAYGYYCLDSADIEYRDQAPIYRWVECSPLFGGAGTQIGRNRDNHEVIQELPFTFTYYGQSFDSVLVSDNGWISFDTTDWYDIRNWNLPDSWGCASQVAAFWDNLDPEIDGTDGIYGWYDEDSHTYVIEWSRMENWESITDDYQTFEILLRDPAHYPTPTGDGEIIFQYKQIVDDDYLKMFSTVGIEDPTETIGLQYAYSSQYCPGAAPLSPGLAIKFTTEVPVYQAIALERFEVRLAPEPAGTSAGLSVQWELEASRGLTGLDLYRQALPSGESQKVNDAPLAPVSGSLFDASATSEGAYLYRMVGTDAYGKLRVLGETDFAGLAGAGPELDLPDGNVLGSGTRILYHAGGEQVEGLAIYDVSGRSVREFLTRGDTPPGPGVITWDGRDDHGRPVAGGVYWVRFTTSAADRTARLVVIR